MAELKNSFGDDKIESLYICLPNRNLYDVKGIHFGEAMDIFKDHGVK